jgi:hypothetical protein
MYTILCASYTKLYTWRYSTKHTVLSLLYTNCLLECRQVCIYINLKTNKRYLYFYIYKKSLPPRRGLPGIHFVNRYTFCKHIYIFVNKQKNNKRLNQLSCSVKEFEKINNNCFQTWILVHSRLLLLNDMYSFRFIRAPQTVRPPLAGMNPPLSFPSDCGAAPHRHESSTFFPLGLWSLP